MKYYLFIDESGDHGLKNIDENFPVFVLCGVILSSNEYDLLVEKMNAIKQDIWKSKEVIFHSRDIRKCNKEFAVLLDLEVKRKFYEKLNKIISESKFTIISATIRKDEYIKKYGKTGNVYSIALSFIIERTIFFIDAEFNSNGVEIIVEKRGEKEDLELSKHYNTVHSVGTFYVSSQRMKSANLTLRFKAKKENINGLQLADLAAYPIANHFINSERVNLPFDLLKSKIYRNKGIIYGLKEFP